MSEEIKRLPDSELEIMLIVWKSNPPVSATYILDRLKSQRKWSLQTLFTVLSRLTEKGFLSCEKQGRSNLYHAIVEENAYKQLEGKSILERVYGNSFKNLVVSLIGGDVINKNDLAELRDYLNRLEEK